MHYKIDDDDDGEKEQRFALERGACICDQIDPINENDFTLLKVNIKGVRWKVVVARLNRVNELNENAFQ